MQNAENNKDIENYKTKDINDIRKWAITCNIRQNHLEKLLKILSRNSYPILPKCAKTFLFTNTASYNIRIMSDIDGTASEFVYFGIEKWLRKYFVSNLHTSSDILLQFNIDGMALFHSSIKQFWPILCKIIYEPDVYRPFCVAIYSGDSKPADSQDFFKEFIQEINQLLSKEFIINETTFNIKIHRFVCDAPDFKKFLKSIIGHGRYGVCERCEIYGVNVSGKKKTCRKIVYPCDINCESRTDASFRMKCQPCHHIEESPLLSIESTIDMIKFFPWTICIWLA